jgi:hypothetical protein
MVTLGLLCLVGLVAMSSLLARGQQALDEKVYRYPHKTLYHLSKAERRFRRTAGGGRFAKSLDELGSAGMITKRLASGQLGEYNYAVIRADTDTWAIEASPAAVTTSSLFFYVDNTGFVRSNRGAKASEASDVYWSPYRRGWGH